MYLTIDTMKTALTAKAKTRLLYMQNTSDNSGLSDVLDDFFDNSILILNNWLKLEDVTTEFLTGMYDVPITNYLVDRHDNIVGYQENKSKITPEGKLKSSVAQRI